MRRAGIGAGLFAVLFALAPATSAGSRWSPPGAISRGPGAVPSVSVSPDGHALAAWRHFLRREGQPEQSIVVVAHRPPGGVFGPPREVTHGGHTERVTVAHGAPGEAILAWDTHENTLYGTRRLHAATLSATGELGPVQTVVEGTYVAGPTLRVNDRGEAVIVWYDFMAKRLSASFRPAGGAFGAPEEVGTTNMGRAGVAISPQGAVAVAWERLDDGPGPPSQPGAPPGPPRNVMVSELSVRPPGGRFGATERIGDRMGPPPMVYDGQSTLVLLMSNRPDEVQTVERPASGGFGAPRRISRPGIPATPIGFAADARGEATVMWREAGGPGWTFHASTRPSGGAFGPPEQVASGTTGQDFEYRLDVGPGGGALATFMRDHPSSNPRAPKRQAFAFWRPPGGAFTRSPVAISAIGVERLVAGLDAAGRGVAVWEHGVDGCVEAAVLGESPASPSPRRCDERPPAVRLVGLGNRVSGRGGRITVRARCDEPCRLSASGRLAGSGRTGRLRTARRRAEPNRTVRLVLRVPAATRRLASRQRRRGRAARVVLRVTASDLAGNRQVARRTLRLR